MNKTKGQLRSELIEAEKKLKSMTTHVKHDVPQYGINDEPAIEWDEYSDPRKARMLQDQIRSLKKQIDDYDHNKYMEEKRQEEQMYKEHQSRQEEIFAGSKKKYDDKVNEYMSKNLWGKAKILFAGKKPKQLTNAEILKNFGTDAINIILESAYKKIEEKRQSVIDYYNEEMLKGEEDPELIKSMINSYNYQFDREKEAVKRDYEFALEQLFHWSDIDWMLDSMIGINKDKGGKSL